MEMYMLGLDVDNRELKMCAVGEKDENASYHLRDMNLLNLVKEVFLRGRAIMEPELISLVG